MHSLTSPLLVREIGLYTLVEVRLSCLLPAVEVKFGSGMSNYVPKFSEVEVDGICQAVCTPISYCREKMIFPKVMFCSRREKIKCSMVEI